MFSYLDPGTGSVIIQAAIGAVAGIGIFGRKAINNVRYKVFKTKDSKAKR